MAADTRQKDLCQWLMDAIRKVRRQKQRPSIERICSVVQNQHEDVTAAEVSAELDFAIRSGSVICVERKGAVSYRESSTSFRAGDKFPRSVDKSPSPAAVQEAVVLAVREIGSGCSQDMIEQHVKKHCENADHFVSADLHDFVTDACKSLIAAHKFSARDGLFFMKSDDESTLSNASSTSAFASDGQLPSTTTQVRILSRAVQDTITVRLLFFFAADAELYFYSAYTIALSLSRLRYFDTVVFGGLPDNLMITSVRPVAFKCYS